MTFQLKQGRAFDPVGWDLVRSEGILKQERLQRGSQSQTCLWLPKSNWSWFHEDPQGNGFQDPYDEMQRNRIRFPQRPWPPQPWLPAGVRPSDQTARLFVVHSQTGRDKFLDRGPPIFKPPPPFLERISSMPNLQNALDVKNQQWGHLVPPAPGTGDGQKMLVSKNSGEEKRQHLMNNLA